MDKGAIKKDSYHHVWIDPCGEIFTNEGTVEISHEWSHALMVELLGQKIPYTWKWAKRHFNQPFENKQGMSFSEGFGDFLAGALWVDEMGKMLEVLVISQVEQKL